MDCDPPRDPDFVIDLESGTGDPSSDENLPKTDFSRLSDQLMSVDDDLENNVKVVIDSKVEVGKKMGKDKRKKGSSAKKPPKPPRPPRGCFSLDAADQKLIKELAELAIIKRARIERMKALKHKKALRASSSSSSSSMNGSLFAMLFTIIFFLMILLQGMSCRNPTSQGSPKTAQTNENGLIFIQEQLNPSASDSILPDSKSSNLLEKISGSGSGSGKSTVDE
ncbi:uncharacterized protein LOC112528046 [Cynara cardunculus var. scolymus]|uniref:Transmembrane protein n=1 Tax=Cynara cardunculus var. scolymus TaxID=59895 RepID=A0A103XT46_CYNCS|nr:uncharacterized protein LOC112528046 [Cynara cardunculus var. scolymus]KVH96423.1 hypothetical protein Ccrd_001488 [Cynara cardunculus var. scolymus]